VCVALSSQLPRVSCPNRPWNTTLLFPQQPSSAAATYLVSTFWGEAIAYWLMYWVLVPGPLVRFTLQAKTFATSSPVSDTNINHRRPRHRYTFSMEHTGASRQSPHKGSPPIDIPCLWSTRVQADSLLIKEALP